MNCKRIGIDLAKNVFQLHGVDSRDEVVIKKRLRRTKIAAFLKFANTVRAHLTGIVRFVQTKISNGVLEGINSKIQLAKRRARGFRNIENFKKMIYFLCGKLTFDYPYLT